MRVKKKLKEKRKKENNNNIKREWNEGCKCESVDYKVYCKCGVCIKMV